MAAETLLKSGEEEQRNQIQAELKDLKRLWEETCTDMVHCHRCCLLRHHSGSGGAQCSH